MYQLLAKRNKPARTLPVADATDSKGKPIVHAKGRAKGSPVQRYKHVRTGSAISLTDEEGAYLGAYLEAQGIAGDYVLRKAEDSPRHIANQAALAKLEADEAKAARAKIARAKAKAARAKAGE